MHKLNLRLPPDLYALAQQEAAARHVSLNTYILQAVANFAEYTQRGRGNRPAASDSSTRGQGARQLRVPAAPSRVQATAHPLSEGTAGPARAATGGAAAAGTVVPKVGRNQPCPCGSRKKYRHCHGDG